MPYLLSLLILSLGIACHATPKSTTFAGSESAYFWTSVKPFGDHPEGEHYGQAFYELASFFNTMDGWRHNMYDDLSANPNWNHFRQYIAKTPSKTFFASPPTYRDDSDLTPNASAQGSRPLVSLDFHGRWRHETFHSESYELFIDKNTASAVVTAPAGTVDGRLSMSPATDKRENMMLDLQLQMNLGSLLFSEMLSSVEEFNKALEPSPAPANGSPRAQTLRSDFGGQLSAPEQEILQRIVNSVPQTAATLLSFSDIRGVLKNVPAQRRDATHIQFMQVVQMDKLEQRYPYTHDDYEDLLDSISFTTRIKTLENKTLALFSYDASSHTFITDVAVANGNFVLQNEDGTLSKEEIKPTAIRELDYQLSSDASISLFGLKIQISNLVIDAEYRGLAAQPRIARPASISMRLNKAPQVEASGAFLHFIPTWLIDLLIPGTIETIVKDVFDEVIAGNQGQGLALTFLFRQQGHEHHQAAMLLQAELPYSAFQGVLEPVETRKGDSVNEPKRLYNQLRSDFRSDFGLYALKLGDARSRELAKRYLAEATDRKD